MTNTGQVRPARYATRAMPGPMFLVGFLSFLGVTVLAAFNRDFTPVLPTSLLFIACVLATWRRLTPAAMAPAIYFAGYLAIVAFLGVLFTNALVGSGGTGGVDVAIDSADAAATANTMLIGASIVLVGAALTRGRPLGVPGAQLLDLGDIGKYAPWFLVVGTIELAALVYFLGVGNLLERPGRLVGRESSIESVFAMAAIAAVVLVSIAIFTRHGFARLYGIALLAGFVGYFMSMGTRRLALLPLLVLLAFAISRRGQIRLIPLVVAVVVSLLMLALPLHFRGQETHGLIPYLGSLSTFDLTPELMATSFNNFLAGFKITAMTAYGQPSIPLDVLWVSITPLEGGAAGWYEVARSLRINQFTPYSAIGELMNYGWPVFIAMMTALGLILGLIQRVNDVLLRDTLGRFVAITTLGLVFIFTIQSAQYNLRSDLRYIYFALGVQAIGIVLLRTRRALESKHGTRRRRR